MADPYRLHGVPSTEDLDKIEREVERRTDREEEPVAGGYTESDLIEYSLERENHRASRRDDRYVEGRDPGTGYYPGTSPSEKISEKFEVTNPEEVRPDSTQLAEVYETLRKAG